MKKITPAIIVFLCIITLLFLCNCSRTTEQVTLHGKMLNYPEVKLEYAGGGTGGVTLPEVPEMRWDFVKEEGKTELTCRLRLQVNFKEEGKFMTKVQFLDLNNFPVTTDKFKMTGKKDEKQAIERTLYLDPATSKRVTKAQILLTPLH